MKRPLTIMKHTATTDTRHGRPIHRSGQSNLEGTKCQVGRVIYRHKRDAQKNSPVKKAERCGRCRNWHPVLP